MTRLFVMGGTNAKVSGGKVSLFGHRAIARTVAA
jgi:hypothetical protein